MEKRFSHEETVKKAEALLKERGVGGVSLRFGADGVHIGNSCLVRDRSLRYEICLLLEKTEGFSRPAAEMSAEWLGHNVYYRLTRHPGAASADVEFDGDKRWYVRLPAKLMAKLGLK